MENQTQPWPERFGLTLCSAADVATAIAANAVGVAVVYSAESVFLVIESRARSLRTECLRRGELGQQGLPASHLGFIVGESRAGAARTQGERLLPEIQSRARRLNLSQLPGLIRGV